MGPSRDHSSSTSTGGALIPASPSSRSAPLPGPWTPHPCQPLILVWMSPGLLIGSLAWVFPGQTWGRGQDPGVPLRTQGKSHPRASPATPSVPDPLPPPLLALPDSLPGPSTQTRTGLAESAARGTRGRLDTRRTHGHGCQDGDSDRPGQDRDGDRQDKDGDGDMDRAGMGTGTGQDQPSRGPQYKTCPVQAPRRAHTWPVIVGGRRQGSP